MPGQIAGTPTLPRAGAGRRPARRRRWTQWEPYVLVAPAALFMLVFFVWPAIQALLRACAATLEAAGWQVGEHNDPRSRARYLLASPRRA